MKILYKNSKLFFLTITFSVLSTTNFAMNYFFGSTPEYVSQTWTNETGSKLEELLSKNKYSEVIKNLNHFIYEQKNEAAFNWTIKQANFGYVSLTHFIVKYHYNMFLQKVANIKQIEHALILAIYSLIFTRLEIAWYGYQQNKTLVDQGLASFKHLQTTYSNYFSKILSEYNYDFKACLGKAAKISQDIFLNNKKFINPAWICTTSLYKDEITFNNPDEAACITSMGKNSAAEIYQTKSSLIKNAIKFFDDQYKTWEDLFSLTN